MQNTLSLVFVHEHDNHVGYVCVNDKWPAAPTCVVYIFKGVMDEISPHYHIILHLFIK